MRISDWSSDVCSSDLPRTPPSPPAAPRRGCPGRTAARVPALRTPARPHQEFLPAGRPPDRAAGLPGRHGRRRHGHPAPLPATIAAADGYAGRGGRDDPNPARAPSAPVALPPGDVTSPTAGAGPAPFLPPRA